MYKRQAYSGYIEGRRTWLHVGKVSNELLTTEISKPVSYTHLDVYKRQAIRCSRYSSRWHQPLSSLHRFPLPYIIRCLDSVPDVYKRQGHTWYIQCIMNRLYETEIQVDSIKQVNAAILSVLEEMCIRDSVIDEQHGLALCSARLGKILLVDIVRL